MEKQENDQQKLADGMKKVTTPRPYAPRPKPYTGSVEIEAQLKEGALFDASKNAEPSCRISCSVRLWWELQEKGLTHVPQVQFRVRRRLLKIFSGLLNESQGQNLALTVLGVTYSLDSGNVGTESGFGQEPPTPL